jgi:gas vesicle protein
LARVILESESTVKLMRGTKMGDEIEVTVTPAEPEPAVVVAPESGAVDDALALVEHVEEDVDKWVDNVKEHAALEARINDLQRDLWSRTATTVAPVEEAVKEAVEEIVEEIVEEAIEEPESEIEVDIEPVEEATEHPARAWDDWDAFKEIHNEGA